VRISGGVDPLTQGLLGAAAAQAAVGDRVPRAWLVGLLAGMAADLDVFIGSETDPLLAIEYHRHFTHALLFVPIGGLLCALPWLIGKKWRERAGWTLLASTAAYATHGLLDACTSYGTQLLWPFTDARVAWDWISIIDPIFTLALLGGVLWCALRGGRHGVAVGGAVALTYLAAGVVQNQRALSAQRELAQSRGHARERGEAFPTIGNNIVWRSLYEYDGTFYADRIRVPWFGKAEWTEGMQVGAVRLPDIAEAERMDPAVVRDFERFRWFSSDWVARAPGLPEVYGDARYSLRTDSFDPIWGVRFLPGASQPTEWVSRTRERDLRLSDLWRELRGRPSGSRNAGGEAAPTQ
jgi:inner membrane protein